MKSGAKCQPLTKSGSRQSFYIYTCYSLQGSRTLSAELPDWEVTQQVRLSSFPIPASMLHSIDSKYVVIITLNLENPTKPWSNDDWEHIWKGIVTPQRRPD